LDFPGVKIEAVKVVGTCKASAPNQLITYFDESHIDLNNAVDAAAEGEVVDIKARMGGGDQSHPRLGRPEVIRVCPVLVG
jgi:hypothetical protein